MDEHEVTEKAQIVARDDALLCISNASNNTAADQATDLPDFGHFAPNSFPN